MRQQSATQGAHRWMNSLPTVHFPVVVPFLVRCSVPELPEVETVVRGLRAVLPGKRILDVRLGKTDFIDDPAALELQLPGSKVLAVRRHGKFIVVELEAASGQRHESSLLIHLGMTGQIVTCPPGVP